MSQEGFEPVIVVFCCWWCAYSAADLAGINKMKYPHNVRIIRVPCSGRVSPLQILQALRLGADGVMINGCLEGACHYIDGNLKAKRRIEQLKKMLDAIGLDGGRVEMYFLPYGDSIKFVNYINEFTERIRRLGPNPLKVREG